MTAGDLLWILYHGDGGGGGSGCGGGGGGGGRSVAGGREVAADGGIESRGNEGAGVIARACFPQIPRSGGWPYFPVCCRAAEKDVSLWREQRQGKGNGGHGGNGVRELWRERRQGKASAVGGSAAEAQGKAASRSLTCSEVQPQAVPNRFTTFDPTRAHEHRMNPDGSVRCY